MSNQKGISMNIENFIFEAIFDEQQQYRVFYELMWKQFTESGFVITDEAGYEIDCVFKAVALQNIVGEFVYRLYDSVNETGLEDVIDYLSKLGIYEDDIKEYMTNVPDALCSAEDFEADVKTMLDYWTELAAEKMLDEFSADDLFDLMFTATYDFEQDFTFDFEDTDEFRAFVDANTDKLDLYKAEFPAVMNWVEQGMVC
ncbi:MAG: hypothetical protein LUH82_02420 [Clostridiales bacterium]|nr:hypothetical protein [Clostridiales bacterium]